MDWINSLSDILSFTIKYSACCCLFLYVSEWISIIYDQLTFKPLVVYDNFYWEAYINELPYIIDKKGEKYFYTDSTSEWNYFETKDAENMHDLICKDLIFRKYLLNYHYSKYTEQILHYYYGEYFNRIEIYKKVHNII